MELSYNDWMAQVDAYIAGICGLGSSDLADGPSRDSFNSGESPEEYARALLEEEGFPFE